jgi:hypothetical protein
MPSLTGQKGIDVRQTGNQLVFRAFLQTSAGALLTTGTVVFYLTTIESDGTILTYDFAATGSTPNQFTSATVTTETLAATYRKSNNGATDTGFWTATLSTLTGFTVGQICMVRCNCSGASPTDQMREFQYGSAEGDLVVTANGTGAADLQADVIKINGVTQVTPGASGGLLIAGSNANTSFPSLTLTNSLIVDGSIAVGLNVVVAGYMQIVGQTLLQDGVVISRTSANSPGMTIAGSGTGAGLAVNSGTGATGDAVSFVASSTNGNAFTLTHAGTGKDLNATTTNSLATNPTQWAGTTIPAPNIAGVPKSDQNYIVGGAVQATVNGGGYYPRVDVQYVGGAAQNLPTATAVAAIQTSVNNLNNLSALASLIGPPAMEVPASGSIAYPMTFLVKDAEGHLLDVSGNTVTLAATNAAGTDRSANLSSVTHAGTGQYTFTYTAQSSAVEEGLTFSASGTASSDSTSRVAYLSAAVVAVDTATAIAAIQAQTTAAQQQANVQAGMTTQGFTTARAGTMPTSGAIAVAGAQMDLVNAPNATAITAIQLGLSKPGTAQTITPADTTAAGTAQATIAGLATMLTASGGNKTFTGDALKNAPTGSGGSGISGPSSVTVTFVDSNAAPVANVPYTVAGQGSGQASSGGVASFGLPNGTYTLTPQITAGVVFPVTTLTVSGTTALTVTGTIIVIPPAPTQNQITGYLYANDGFGNAVVGAVYYFAQTAPPPGETGQGNSSNPATVTSVSAGQVSYPFRRGATYAGWTAKGSATPTTFIVPALGDNFALPDVLGRYT